MKNELSINHIILLSIVFLCSSRYSTLHASKHMGWHAVRVTARLCTVCSVNSSSTSAELTIKQRKLSVEPTGALHCLSSVTALKGEHATHCGEPDCSGVIDQLPGVIPRYRAAETNAGKNTRNLLSPASSRRQGESSPFPQAKRQNTGMDAGVMCYLLLVETHALN